MTAPILLITRPEPSGHAFAEAVRKRWTRPLNCILSPLMAIRQLPVQTPSPWPAGVVVTSAHGAKAVAALGPPAGLPAWCVGDRTAREAEAAGLAPISGGRDADTLVALILSRRPPGPLWHVHGAHVRGDIAARLTAAGIPTTATVAYRQEAQGPTDAARAALSGDAPVAIPLFSPRSAGILAEIGQLRAPIHIIAMSGAVAEAAATLDTASLDVAAEPTAEAMVEATCRTLEGLSKAHGA